MVVSGNSFLAPNSSQAPSNFDNFVNFKVFNKVLQQLGCKKSAKICFTW